MSTNRKMPPAVILAGGEGKRLRPLTATTPKPLLPMSGEGLIFHILRRLENMGVETAYMMTGYLGDKLEAALAGYTGKLRPICFREEKPMGSAGCLTRIPALASLDECLVVSGDAYFEFDLREAVSLRREKDAAAVMCLARVDSPISFGMVESDHDGRIRGFIEKPTWSRVQGDLVNTGIYVLGRKALHTVAKGGVPLDFGSDVFPALLKNGETLYSIAGQGYWCDIGTPEAYRLCNLRLSGGRSVFGAGVKLASTASLSHSVLFDGVQVGAGANVKNAVIGEDTTVGDGATVEAGAVVGASCVIGDRSYVGGGVTLPAGTIVAARSILRADFNMETQGHFSEGRLILRPDDPTGCGNRTGRAFAACAGENARIALMRGEKKGQSDFVRGLAEGILAGGADLVDCGWGFPAQASFTAQSGNAVYTLFSDETEDEIRLWIFDGDGLYPDARFERKFTDYIRELPKEPARSGEISTDKETKERYRAALCTAAGQAGCLQGMTVRVKKTVGPAAELLEKALKWQGASISEHADLIFAPSEDGNRTDAVIYGIHAGWWQIFTVLALEHVKKNGEVLLPYCCPEYIKRTVSSAGGRIVLYTLYPENGSEKYLRSRLAREQPFAVDGLAAAMLFAGMIATGVLRAGELSAICNAMTVDEEEVRLSYEKDKMRMIVAHRRDFDGEGLLRRYREGSVRVLAGTGASMRLMAEAADGADAAELIRKVKKEILGRDV